VREGGRVQEGKIRDLRGGGRTYQGTLDGAGA
jgi:hypothetical protein